MICYLLIEISHLPKERALYLKVQIQQIVIPVDIFALKSLYTKYWAYISIGILITGGHILFFHPVAYLC